MNQGFISYLQNLHLDREALGRFIFWSIYEGRGDHYWDLLEATGDTAYNSDTFLKAADYVLSFEVTENWQPVKH